MESLTRGQGNTSSVFSVKHTMVATPKPDRAGTTRGQKEEREREGGSLRDR